MILSVKLQLLHRESYLPAFASRIENRNIGSAFTIAGGPDDVLISP